MNRTEDPIEVRDRGLSAGVKVLLVIVNMIFLPIPGLVWWLVIRDDKPRTAKEVARMTWLSVGLWILLIVGIMILGILLA